MTPEVEEYMKRTMDKAISLYNGDPSNLTIHKVKIYDAEEKEKVRNDLYKYLNLTSGLSPEDEEAIQKAFYYRYR
jgi:hypothetical protein